MLTSAAVAVSTANRWLLAGITAGAIVLALAAYARSKGRENGQHRGTRRLSHHALPAALCWGTYIIS